MEKWEYKFVQSISEFHANQLGHEGWELVGFTPNNEAVFKRRL